MYAGDHDGPDRDTRAVFARKPRENHGNSGQTEKKWKKRIFRVDSFGGPAYKPRSPPHGAITNRLSDQVAKRRTLFENVRNFGRDSRVAVVVNVPSFVNTKSAR